MWRFESNMNIVRVTSAAHLLASMINAAFAFFNKKINQNYIVLHFNNPFSWALNIMIDPMIMVSAMILVGFNDKIVLGLTGYLFLTFGVLSSIYDSTVSMRNEHEEFSILYTFNPTMAIYVFFVVLCVVVMFRDRGEYINHFTPLVVIGVLVVHTFNFVVQQIWEYKIGRINDVKKEMERLADEDNQYDDTEGGNGNVRTQTQQKENMLALADNMNLDTQKVKWVVVYNIIRGLIVFANTTLLTGFVLRSF